MAELLLELLSEEIPARMQARAREDLARLLAGKLAEAGLEYKDIRTFATPRRLTAVVDGLPARSPDLREEKKGPRVDAPDAAIKGFLKSAGLASVDQAEQRDDKKGAYYVATIEKRGRATAEAVAEIVPDIVKSFPWPKSMRWGAGKLRWVRPLHSILCLLDGKVVEFEIDGIKSGKKTRGHRFMAPEPFAVKNFADYAKRLREAKVVLDGDERANMIRDGARKLAKDEKLTLVEDEGLLAENAGLTEWPAPLMGSFDQSFLAVPAEVLATAMKAHQKCFSLRDKQGKLANRFILIANLKAKDGGKAIVAGNERVIAARLADAKFFFDQDRKVMLPDRVPALKDIVFHEKLGSQYERIQRVWKLAREIAPLVGADPDLAERAAILSKADLLSDMVGEFPELQGVMGRYYALDQQENPSVANAIAAHYKPLGPSDDVPREPVAIAVALADKLDMLVGFWAIDEKPTGSKDPYALRRAALGVIRIILENDRRASLRPIFERHLLRWLAQVPIFELSQAFLAYDNSEANEDLLRLALAARSAGVAAPLVSPEADRFAEIKKLPPQGFDPDPTKDEWIRRVDDFTRWYIRVEEFTAGSGAAESLAEIDSLGKPLAQWAAGIRDDLLAFFADRLKVHLREKGARHDLVDAVFALGGNDLLMIVKRVEALGRFLDTEDGEHLLTGTKRAINIIRIEEKKDNVTYDQAPDPNLLKRIEEKALAKAVDEVEQAATAAVAREDFAAAMAAMALLRGPVDAFFDSVTVNTQEPGLRENRLRLLNRIRATTLTVADFSKIEG